MTNPWESRARTLKAIAISDHIIESRWFWGSRTLLAWVECASYEQKREWEAEAGQHVASDATWAEIKARVASAIVRQAAEAVA